MSKASSVSFASILVSALVLSAPASAASIFQKGAAQYANNLSDGQFKVDGKVNDNGTESYLVSSLSQPKSPFSAGNLPAGMWKLDGFDNNDANGDWHSSGGDKSGVSQTGATSGSGGSNGGDGMGGVSGGAGGSPALNNLSSGKGSPLNDPVLALTTTGTTTANDSAGDPSPAAPLPGALPLLTSGLAALGLLGWRRKRKARAVA